MSNLKSAAGPLSGGPGPDEAPASVLLIPYPKIVFLYPLLIASVVAAVVVGFAGEPLKDSHTAKVVCTLFLGVLTLNLVILAFDFPRTTSLTLFFLAVAI